MTLQSKKPANISPYAGHFQHQYLRTKPAE
ncbi:MAG: hypothetical protein RL189_1275, partial [Pseudomonadota bacterium]